MAQSGLLWWWRERPLQQLVCVGGVVVFVGACVAQVATAGAVGMAVWMVGAALVVAGLRRWTPLPMLTETVGAGSVVVGALITTNDWTAFGLLLAVATAFALLALAAVPGLVVERADRRLLAIVGAVALLQGVPSAIGYFAREAGAATGLVVWAVGAALLLLAARTSIRRPEIATALGSIAIIGGAALTGAQWPGFAPIFGIVSALALVALGMLPGQVLLSVFGSLGLLINVPWAIGYFFPGEGRAPLLILISGALILGVAVLLTRERGRFHRELGGRGRGRGKPPRHAVPSAT
jgi:hypothetical protein